MNNLVTWTAPSGGAGTTTAVWHMAQVATTTEDAVLIVDLSPSRALSQLAGVESSPGLAGILQQGQDLQSAILPTAAERLHILPAGDLHEMLLVESLSQGTLNETLTALAQGPHSVFVDLPAGFPFLLSQVAELSSWVLVSQPCRSDAVTYLADVLEPLISKTGSRPSVGVVLNQFAPWSSIETELYRMLRKTLPQSALWKTVIPFDETFDETARRHLPATLFASKNPGPKAYLDLFGEWRARRALLHAAAEKTERPTDQMSGGAQ